MPHNLAGLLLGFFGATTIEGLASMSKGELLAALLGSQSSKDPRRLPVVRMRREPQAPRVLNSLFDEFARTARFRGDHRKAGSVMVADALTVIMHSTVLIDGELGAQTESVDQKDARFDTLSGRLETGNDDPANALGKEVLRPEGLVRGRAGSAFRLGAHAPENTSSAELAPASAA